MTDWTEVEHARAKAHAKHGDDSIEGLDASDPRWLAILVEEGGETSEANLLAWNALLQARIGRVAHEQTYDATGSLRSELVDVLAVASAWLDALDDEPLHREPAEDPVCSVLRGPHASHAYESGVGDPPDVTWTPRFCPGVALSAEPVGFVDMAPGTTFGYPTRWEVSGRGGMTGRAIAEMVEESTTRYLDDLDPSTIHDVTPPPATPEESDRG
jgi:hypothetical protein